MALQTYFVFTDEAGVYQQHPSEKTIRNSPFYIRSNVIMTAEAYKAFQSDMQELNKKYGVPVGEEIKWADLWSLHKNNPRTDFIATMSEDKLKGYYRRVFHRAQSAVFLFTITSLRGQNCVWSEDTLLRFHLQEALQRIQMDAQSPEGFAMLIMDELNEEKLKHIKSACHELTVRGDFISKYSSVYHGVLTECSAQSFGIQLADFAAGAMNGYMRRALYDKSNYAFAKDLCDAYVLPRLRHHTNGAIMGYGVREVPSNTTIRSTLLPLFQNIEFK